MTVTSSELAQVLADAVATWPAAGAVAVTDAEATVAETGPTDEVRPWASVTKLVTALATLVAIEEGSVGLDAPAGPPGATVRHLLAHASGVAPDDDAVLAPPGRRRIYSNRGFELLGSAIEDATGMPWADYVAAAVLDPLGMTGSEVTGSPAAGGRGPLRDLVLLGRELLAPRLVSPTTLAEATTVVFPGLDGVLPGYGRQQPNDWGLGFELRDGKHPHWTGTTNSPATFGHYGRAGSFVWVDPRPGVACVCLGGQAWGPWAERAWPPMSDAVLALIRAGKGGSSA